ncbi:hypothetical protein [Desulfoglaeba alkanexedens]|uniref:hypothetical protein n=1 Tax=Desulfoglaeba alkanexedens TaxID=361111 RepID=UPI001B85E3A4|nr:hypothetical protein [Desulfoglaeba alkanexedens]
MLEHTFCHVPGIGRTTEARLWREGILRWEDLKGSGSPSSRGLLRRRECLLAPPPPRCFRACRKTLERLKGRLVTG